MVGRPVQSPNLNRPYGSKFRPYESKRPKGGSILTSANHGIFFPFSFSYLGVNNRLHFYASFNAYPVDESRHIPRGIIQNSRLLREKQFYIRYPRFNRVEYI